ncbi:replication initiation protein, partial [Bacteroides xylanisolvens]
MRENPNNKRSKVTGFRFYPVYQPQFRDEELEGKELQAKVTEFELNKALALPTGYSLRFYMLMSGQVYPLDISLENLKDRLGIPADKYKDKNGKDRIDHFEERVLKPAKAALDES